MCIMIMNAKMYTFYHTMRLQQKYFVMLSPPWHQKTKYFLSISFFIPTEWIKVRWVTIMVMWKTAASKLTSQLKYYYSWIFYFWFFIQCKENRHYFVCPSVANPNTYFSYTCFYISNNYCWNLQYNFMWEYQRILFIFGRTLLVVQFAKIAKQPKHVFGKSQVLWSWWFEY